ncbi:MAG: two-component system response regulator [Gammaproteobacteria bacterium]|nr:two-component system response regulator [Gammaproteobacteria bacterium]
MTAQPKEPDRATILVVDDTPENIDVLVGILGEDYQVRAARGGEQALKLVRKAPPDLILLDIMMPEVDGFEVCRRLKEDYTTRHIPIIFVTAKIEMKDELAGLDLGAVDYITKPVSPPIVRARVRTHLALYDQNRELERQVRARTAELHETRLKIIQRLGRAAEYKDNETGTHVIRMSHYSRILGLAAGMSEAEADTLMNAAPMHDIGKIGIPDHILRKRGRLDDDEWQIMRTHPEIGGEIIGDDESELLAMARVIALTHHEKWNGSGYPLGLSGEQIPRVSRIIAIADVFDALTSPRPYKQAWSIEDALAMLQEGAGVHFDPQLVTLFLEHLPEVLEIKERFAEPSHPDTDHE